MSEKDPAQAIEDLIAIARKQLEFGIAYLKENGSLSQQFFLVRADGVVEIILVEGSVTNSEDGKSRLSRMIKNRVRGSDARAVIMLSDIYFAEDLTPEQDAVRQRHHWTISEAHENGLCERKEAVFVSLESPIISWVARQEYRRAGDGQFEFIGEPKVLTAHHTTGRFAEYWGSQAGNA